MRPVAAGQPPTPGSSRSSAPVSSSSWALLFSPPGRAAHFLLSSGVMTRAICCALAILAAIVAAPAAQHVPTLQAGDIVITGGQLFDSVRDTLAPNTGIVVRRGIFLEVGANLTGRDTSAATVVQLEAGDTGRALIARIRRMIARNEYKRRQAPPILRVRARAFGSGRQMPIAAHYS